MIRFIATSDLHIHPFRNQSRNGGEDRLADGLSAMRQTLQAARDRDCPWCFLGDLKQCRGVWDQRALSGVLALLQEYGDVRKVMLPGNGGHDGLDVKGSGETGLDPCRPLAMVIPYPLVWEAPNAVFDQPVAFWPWRPTLDELPDLLDAARVEGAHVLLGHGFLQGAALGPEDRRLNLGIPLETFGLLGPREQRTFDLAVFGDIHKQQMLGDATGHKAAQIWYPGSPYAQSWGEREPHKGCLYVEQVDDHRYEVTPIEVDAPHYMVLHVATRDAMVNALANLPKGNFVRVVMPQGLAQMPETEMLLAAARSQSRHFEVVLAEETAPVPTVETTMHAGQSSAELLEEYVKARPPAKELGAPAKVLAAGKELWEG